MTSPNAWQRPVLKIAISTSAVTLLARAQQSPAPFRLHLIGLEATKETRPPLWLWQKDVWFLYLCPGRAHPRAPQLSDTTEKIFEIGYTRYRLRLRAP